MNAILAVLKEDAGLILTATLIVSVLGIVFGVILSVASRVFKVHEDEKFLKIRSVLPGANCGACGFQGCDAFASALAEHRAGNSSCPVGGEDVAKKISEILGIIHDTGERKIARVLCAGTASISRDKYQYQGISECFAASTLFAGHKSCHYGCLGLGTCKRACPFGAIEMVDNVAVIQRDLCKSCEICVEACPRNLITMVPVSRSYTVVCTSKDNGALTRKKCNVGCIGCGKCVKVCPSHAIVHKGALAVIEYDKCTNCSECLNVCPVHAIQYFRSCGT